MNTNLGRTEVAVLTNKSGGFLGFGDVVIVDVSNAASFVTTTTAGYLDGRIGVILDPGGIADDAPGTVAFSGFVPRINLDGSAAVGDAIACSSVAGQGTPHAAPLTSGDFAQSIGTGSNPAALLFGTPMIVSNLSTVYFAPSGLTGATAGSRYVGATSSGAPVTGTFLQGDYVIDRSGSIYICTVAGSPGTWVAPGGGGGGSQEYEQEKLATTQTITSLTDLTGLSITKVLTSGVFYRWTLDFGGQKGSTGTLTTYITDESDVVKQERSMSIAGGFLFPGIITWVEEGTGASVTRKARAYADSGNYSFIVSSTQDVVFSVERTG